MQIGSTRNGWRMSTRREKVEREAMAIKRPRSSWDDDFEKLRTLSVAISQLL